MTQARLCPSCKKLNSATESTCNYCGVSLSGASKASLGVYSAELAATKFLVGLCLVNFAMLVIINGRLPLGFGGPPASGLSLIGAGAIVPFAAPGQHWRLISANFVHLSFLHLVLNMYALLSFGRSFEDRFDGRRLVVTYLLTGVSGFALSSYLYGELGPPTAGASASLFGLIGVEIASLVAQRQHQRAKEAFIQYLIMAIALAIVFPTNNFAHLGGFVAGVPIGLALSRERSVAQHNRIFGVAAVMCTVAAIGSIVFSLAWLFLVRQAHAAG